jgi:glycosyltransferase involved in cell wall biosynthesis
MHLKSLTKPKTVAIVAAYNEAPRIGAVLDVLTSYPGFDEVIVVNDGSTDTTGSVALHHHVTLIDLSQNHGKGKAMQVGVDQSDADIIFFCDADVTGLSHRVIAETLAPVALGRLDMKIAMRNRKIYYLRCILKFIPLLGGERAVTRKLWDSVPDDYKNSFKIEAALNFWAFHYGKGYTFQVFPGLSQTIKERKYGFVRGFIGRIGMSFDVCISQLLLHARKSSSDSAM